MFHKQKTPNNTSPTEAKAKPKPQEGVVIVKNAKTNPRHKKDSKQAKADMKSEGGL